jgi:hypothetical protein
VAEQTPALASAQGFPPEQGHEHIDVVAGHTPEAGSAAKQEMPSSCWQGLAPEQEQILFVGGSVGAKVGLKVGCNVGKKVG